MKLIWLLLACLTFGEVSARSKCGPQIVDATTTSSSSSRSSSKRSVGYLRIERNVTRTAGTQKALAKRMNLPDDPSVASSDFYEFEFTKVTREFVIPNGQAEPRLFSGAMMQKYSPTRRSQMSTGMEGLMGCTALYIISRRAIYVTHWWEDISFDPAARWKKKHTPEELFQITVIDQLRNGGRFHAPLDAEQIEDNHIKAYLVHPKPVFRQIVNPDQNLPDYSEQWNQIKTTVGELVPMLADTADTNRWIDVEYYPAEEKELDEDGSVRGKSLFKYDSAHVTSTGQKQKMNMLWVEEKLVHRDIW